MVTTGSRNSSMGVKYFMVASLESKSSSVRLLAIDRVVFVFCIYVSSTTQSILSTKRTRQADWATYRINDFQANPASGVQRLEIRLMPGQIDSEASINAARSGLSKDDGMVTVSAWTNDFSSDRSFSARLATGDGAIQSRNQGTASRRYGPP